MAEQVIAFAHSPEQVAFKLLERIATVEGKSLIHEGRNDRQWILDTFAECLTTVRRPQDRQIHE